MSNEIAIVTGSSSGFGLLTTLELAKRGCHVIATMRNLDKCAHLNQEMKVHGLEGKIDILELDVTSEASIFQLQTYIKTLDKIDILINNAGYASGGFAEEVSLAEYKEQFETNVFGLIAVTQSIIPIMRKHRKGKIINLSSISGKIGFPGLSPYVASKHAIEGWSECLRLEMKPFGIDVHLVEPGSYQTNIWTSGKKVSQKSLQDDSPYFDTMKKIENYLVSGESQFGDPMEVATLIVDISLRKTSKFRHPIGKGVKLGIQMKNTLPWQIWESMILKRLNG